MSIPISLNPLGKDSSDELPIVINSNSSDFYSYLYPAKVEADKGISSNPIDCISPMINYKTVSFSNGDYKSIIGNWNGGACWTYGAPAGTLRNGSIGNLLFEVSGNVNRIWCNNIEVNETNMFYSPNQTVSQYVTYSNCLLDPSEEYAYIIQLNQRNGTTGGGYILRKSLADVLSSSELITTANNQFSETRNDMAFPLSLVVDTGKPSTAGYTNKTMLGMKFSYIANQALNKQKFNKQFAFADDKAVHYKTYATSIDVNGYSSSLGMRTWFCSSSTTDFNKMWTVAGPGRGTSTTTNVLRPMTNKDEMVNGRPTQFGGSTYKNVNDATDQELSIEIVGGTITNFYSKFQWNTVHSGVPKVNRTVFGIAKINNYYYLCYLAEPPTTANGAKWIYCINANNKYASKDTPLRFKIKPWSVKFFSSRLVIQFIDGSVAIIYGDTGEVHHFRFAYPNGHSDKMTSKDSVIYSTKRFPVVLGVVSDTIYTCLGTGNAGVDWNECPRIVKEVDLDNGNGDGTYNYKVLASKYSISSILSSTPSNPESCLAY